MIDSLSLTLEIESIMRAAGNILIEYYYKEYFINKKQDNSVVTAADLASHDYILEKLSKISDIPIVSEENYEEFLNESLDDFWILDPLDGTKEFINKNDEFCICLGLISNKESKLGFIYNPTSQKLFSSYNKKILPNDISRKYKVALSRSHSSYEKEILDIVLGKENYEIYKMGSALKFCEMYNGNIDLYLRLAPCKEWDIAAGQAIIEAAGFELISLETKQKMLYNKKDFLNDYFVAYNKNIESLAFKIINMVS